MPKIQRASLFWDHFSGMNDEQINRWLLVLCIVAAFSLYIGLIFPYRGEEGVYTASSFEMLFNHNYHTVYLMGSLYERPPFYNWLILGVAKIIGYPHMLIAARFVNVSSVIGSTALLCWLATELKCNKRLVLLAVLCFLSGDLLFRRSWIAYSDTTFSFFVFAAMCAAWVGYRRQQQRWLLIVFFALSAAFLTKALTCYVFYAVLVLTIMIQQKKWRYYFHPISIMVHIAVLAFPITWFLLTLDAHHTTRMFKDLLENNNEGLSFLGYLIGILHRTVEIVLRFAPISLLVIACLFLKNQRMIKPAWVKIVFYTSLIAALPYLLAPHPFLIRYILPLFPFIALLFAYVIWQHQKRVLGLSIAALAACIALKLFVSPFGLPFFERMSNQYPSVSQDILNKTVGYPLFAGDSDGIVATLDALRYPAPPMVTVPRDLDNIFYVGNPEWHKDKIVQVYDLTRERVALFCRGKACQQIGA